MATESQVTFIPWGIWFMQKNLALAALAVTFAFGTNASAARETIYGSDTLHGVISTAITTAHMEGVIEYAAGGSGEGESRLAKGTQGIAPMSRAMKPDVIAELQKSSVNVIQNVIGLDGVGIFVNSKNKLAGIAIETIRDIFTCQVMNWDKVPGSKLVGAIKVYRRNDKSGTTDTFKNLVGLKEFGSCVTVVDDTLDISNHTSTEENAIGFAGLSALRKDGANSDVPVAPKLGAPAVSLTAGNVRANTYPLSRKLYVMEVSGARQPSASEQALLKKLKNRSFLDPILQDNEFFTLP